MLCYAGEEVGGCLEVFIQFDTMHLFRLLPKELGFNLSCPKPRLRILHRLPTKFLWICGWLQSIEEDPATANNKIRWPGEAAMEVSARTITQTVMEMEEDMGTTLEQMITIHMVRTMAIGMAHLQSRPLLLQCHGLHILAPRELRLRAARKSRSGRLWNI